MLHHLRKSLFGLPTSCSSKKPTYRPALEVLEDRTLPAIAPTDFLVNSARTIDRQHSAATASSANGMSVAVWTEVFSVTDEDIQARLFNTSGVGVREIDVTISSQRESMPDVAMVANGRFIIVWTDSAQGNSDVRFRIYSNTGALLRDTTTVQRTSSHELDPSVACDANGNFVISFTHQNSSRNIIAQRYDAAGNTIGSGIIVGGSTANEDRSRVAMDSQGRFSIAYVKDGNLILKSYSSSGTFKTGHLVRSNITGRPDVAVDNIGNTMVVWSHVRNGDNDVFAVRVNNAGVMGSTRAVTGSTAQEIKPTIAMDRDGSGYVVAYEVFGSANRVEVREFTQAHTQVGSHNLGPTRTTPSITINGFDGYLLAFERR